MKGYKGKKLEGDDKEKMIEKRENGKRVIFKKKLKNIGEIKPWEDQRLRRNKRVL